MASGFWPILSRLSGFLRTWAAGVWTFVSNLFHRLSWDAARPPSPETSSISPTTTTSPRPYPRRIRYVPVPGEWQRELFPHWPDSVFRVPDVVPEGYIYYITKGDYVRTGSTALVERLPSGHVAKTPLPNAYSTWEEQKNRQSMDREYQVYRLISPSPFSPKLIEWDDESKTLVLEDCVNGDLESFIRSQRDTQSGSDTNATLGLDPATRQKWSRQAAQALAHLHQAGVVHQDVAPRNFLLTEKFDLKICDFAGSSYPGHSSSTGAPGPRYQSKVWGRGYVPTRADDIFGLGSVLYFISAGEEPYKGMEDEEVERSFENGEFPACDHFEYGAVIRRCWDGQLATAEDVVQDLASLQDTDSV